MNYELFTEYVTVEVDYEKSYKVGKTVKEKLGSSVYQYICRAALSLDGNKADDIYRVIAAGLACPEGDSIMNHLAYDPVRRVFKNSRRVWNEAHHYKEFLRFHELKNGVLFGRISPKYPILSLIAVHFADRLPEENFMIYDDVSKQAVLHIPNSPWILVSGKEVEEFALLQYSDCEMEYQALWQNFFRSIAIKERESQKRQGTMLPLRFRSHMTEFY